MSKQNCWLCKEFMYYSNGECGFTKFVNITDKPAVHIIKCKKCGCDICFYNDNFNEYNIHEIRFNHTAFKVPYFISAAAYFIPNSLMFIIKNKNNNIIVENSLLDINNLNIKYIENIILESILK